MTSKRTFDTIGDCRTGHTRAEAVTEILRLREINAELLAALEGSLQFLIAWQAEFAYKPATEYVKAQRERIAKQYDASCDAIAKATSA
jgi:hypothetical protein